MQIANILAATAATATIAAAVLGMSVPAPKNGTNGARVCAGGAISCHYQKGRCANICDDSHAAGTGTPAVIDPFCSCPEGRADNKYTGAACIDVFRALARHGC
ncbi:hypothetical protein CTA1_12776 [Colletotrichum tanaceti]|uniref:Uncharacterized protein n=1 Tax=Colletotrichum tanaceti TaxID=1306861 RepID=A0A4U6XKI1_9PEZI|nr:hypothetical protein CTA1_12776 [Colletotrichum tanaceti]